MNDRGITSTMSYLRIICDKAMSMTDLSEELADVLSLQNADQVWTFLNVNATNFGLETESQIKEAYYPMYDLIVSRFHSCVNGMMVNAVAVTTNVTENKTMNAGQQDGAPKPNLFSKLLPRV
jgi:hypothetical protein